MADFRPLLWDPSGPVKRRFSDTDTLELDTNGTNSIFDLKISSSSIFVLGNDGILTHTPPSITATSQLLGIVGISGGLANTGKKVSLLDLAWTEHASAEVASIYGVNIALTPHASANNTKYGVYVDGDWDYGLYSRSKGYITKSYTGSGIVSETVDIRSTSTGITGASNEITGIQSYITSNASDLDVVYIGFSALYTGAAPDAEADARGFYATGWDQGFHASSTNDYGLYSLAKTYVLKTYIGSGIADVTSDTRSTSTGITGASNEITGIQSYVTSHANDLDIEYTGFNALYIANAPAAQVIRSSAFRASSAWDFGLYSQAKLYTLLAPTSAPGGNLNVTDVRHSSAAAALGGGDQVRLLHLQRTGNASDTGSIVCGIYAEGEATGSSQKYAIYSDANWDYSIYGLAKASFSDSFTSSGKTIDASATSTTLAASQIMAAIEVDVIGHGSDPSTALIYGVHAKGTTFGSAFKYGFYADSAWHYGLYSASPICTNITATNNPLAHDINITSSGITTGFAMSLIDISFTQSASDTSTINGIELNLTPHASATSSTRGVYVDDVWDYSFYGLAKGLFSDTLSDTGNVITVNSTSGGLALGEILTGVKSSITGNAGDHASSGIYGFYAVGSTVGNASKAGLYIDANWDGGVISYTKSYFQSDPANGSGSLEEWVVESKVNTDTAGLAGGDEVAAYKATLEDDNNDGEAYYYGIYIKTTSAGSAHKWGVYFDTTWPVDQYALRINSGLNHLANDFGTTGNGVTSDHITVQTSGDLGTNAVGTALDINVSADSGADGSSWHGVLAHCVNSNAKVSYAFKASQNWDYGFYSTNGSIYVAGNLNSMSSPTTQGTVHLAISSSSGIAVSNYYGGTRVHYTRHTSDAAGNIFAHYVNSNGTSGNANYYGLFADTNVDIGVGSLAETSAFSRGTSGWTSSTLPVLKAENANTSNIQAALKVISAHTGSTSKCLEIDHSFAGGNTEDTRRAIVFTSAQMNKRQIPPSLFHPNTYSSTYWYLQTTGTSHRWRTTGTAARTIVAPLTVPHNAVIKEVAVRCYHTVVSTTACKITLYRHTWGNSTSTSQGTQNGSTATASQSVTLSGLSVTVDNTGYDYYIQFVCGVTGSSSANYLYSAYVIYEIIDFAAGCGW